MQKQNHIVIQAKTNFLNLNLKELLQYKDLIWIFFKKNYMTRYKQTILGSAWLIISPLFTIFTYTLIFGNIAGLSTDGIPKPLFYLAGNIFWSLFTDSLNTAAGTFVENSGIFGKVYFPRLVMPISGIIVSCADFMVRLLLMFAVILIYYCKGDGLFISTKVWLIPILMLQVCLLGMGLGMLVSALTTKYRDLQVMVGFGVQIWMYATPVIYATSMIPSQYEWIIRYNPVAASMLLFKNIFFQTDSLPIVYWEISWIITFIALFVGVMVFNRVEKTFMDTV